MSGSAATGGVGATLWGERKLRVQAHEGVGQSPRVRRTTSGAGGTERGVGVVSMQAIAAGRRQSSMFRLGDGTIAGGGSHGL